jgi:SAM-dependent methyltransferase
MSHDLKSTERFSDRVQAYVKYRPGYPEGVLQLLRREFRLGPGRIAADVGSGTGIFSKLLLQSGCSVVGIEPNAPMRDAAAEFLSAFPTYRGQDGTAERTGLGDASVDLVTCAQAFHWFDAVKASTEFRRILKAGGGVAIVWNDRALGDRGFGDAYEKFLHEHGTDYAQVSRVGSDQVEHIYDYFKPEKLQRVTFPNFQLFDFDGLLGRVRSASYSPRPDSPAYASMVAALRELHEKYADEQAQVRFEYETVVFYGLRA